MNLITLSQTDHELVDQNTETIKAKPIIKWLFTIWLVAMSNLDYCYK